MSVGAQINRRLLVRHNLTPFSLVGTDDSPTAPKEREAPESKQAEYDDAV